MTAQEKLTSRLNALPTEQLVQLLMHATKGNPALRKQLMFLTAETKELVAGVKRSITSLHKLDGSTKRLSASTIAFKVRDVVRAIARIAEQSADDAFALLCSLLTTEGPIHEEVDDSYGYVTDVFRGVLVGLAGSTVVRCRNEKMLLASLLDACGHDELGTVQNFIDAVAPSLPENIVRAVMKKIDARVPDEQPESHFQYDANVEMLKRFHVALGEVEEYTDLCHTTTGMRDTDLLVIAEMYCEHDEFRKAEGTLQMVSMQNQAVQRQRVQLQVRVLKALGQNDKVVDIFRAEFLASPSLDSLTDVSTLCGADAATSLVHELLNSVQTSSQPDFETLVFLIRHGFASEVTDILISTKRPDYIDYHKLGFIANEFILLNAWLGATMAYRMLIEDMLHHSKTTTYPFATSYVKQLNILARHITSWDSVVPHEEYMSTLREEHPLQTAFLKMF